MAATVFVTSTQNRLCKSSRVTTRKTNKKQPTNSKRKPQRDHAPLIFALLMGTALLSLCIGLANRMVQTQKRLETVQSKLQKISEEIVEAKARAFEFQDAALDLRRELDDSETIVTQSAKRCSDRQRTGHAAEKRTDLSGNSSCGNAIAAQGYAERSRSRLNKRHRKRSPRQSNLGSKPSSYNQSLRWVRPNAMNCGGS